MTGQITPDSALGTWITKLAGRPDVKTIVEIGTWNGLGGTTCVLTGIGDASKTFISIELYEEFYQLAKRNLINYTHKVTLLNGSIVTVDNLRWIDDIDIEWYIANNLTHPLLHLDHAKQWYHKDLHALKNSVNLFDQMPNFIDLLILDGGEYTTYPEWLLLKDRTKIFVLDDTKLLKCHKIRKEMLDSNCFDVIIDEQNDRNGYSIFIRL